MADRFYVKYAWIFLVLVGLLEIQFGLSLTFTGPTAIDNANLEIQGARWTEIAATSSEATLIDYAATSWGISETFVAVVIIVIAAVPFRKGDRWAWYFCWLFPAFAGATVTHNLIAGVTSVVLIDSLGAVLFIVPLIVTYRRFFPSI